MEVIYKAWDGTEFRERDACEAYEYNNPCAIMYDNAGRASKPDEAFVVVLKRNNDAENFIGLCKTQDTIFDGITYGDRGLFVWDDHRDEYFYVSDRVEEALKRYFED